MIILTKETARFRLRITITRLGNDMSVTLSGGDTPHIGAQALAIPYPSLDSSATTDASVSLIVVTGHKEDNLARNTAYTLATRFNCVASVSCGIHIDNATTQEINNILDVSNALLSEAIHSMEKQNI